MSPTDYATLLRRNLADVFSQRDAAARLRAIEELYSADPTLYEPENVVHGRGAISDTIGRLLATLPTDFVFRTTGPASGHHDLCCVRWQGGPATGQALLTGTDIAHCDNGRITALYVFIDAPAK